MCIRDRFTTIVRNELHNIVRESDITDRDVEINKDRSKVLTIGKQIIEEHFNVI